LKISGQSGKLLDSVNVLDSLEMFRTVWKTSGQSGIFPNSLEDFWTVWRIFRQSGRFLDRMEGFQTVWKISGQVGRFPDGLVFFRTVPTISGQSGKCSRQSGKLMYSIYKKKYHKTS